MLPAATDVYLTDPMLRIENLTYRIGARALFENANAFIAEGDRKSTRLNSSHRMPSRMPSSA